MPSNTTSDGWCPFAIQKRVPEHKYWLGNKGRAAVVMHVAEGAIGGMVKWFLGGSQATAHFGIGPDGALYQFVSVHNSAFGNGASFRNGRWHDPTGRAVRPAWTGLRATGENPNWYTISVEHAGYFQERWTDAMDATNTKLLIWLAEQFPSLAPYEPGKTLIGHCDISPVERKNCPGPHVDYGRIAAAANGRQALAVNTPQTFLAPVAESSLTEHSPILARPRATPEQVTEYILARPHGEYTKSDIARTIIPTYWKVCAQAGVDPLIAVAQMIHETGNLSSAWSQRPKRNPAGIGVTGESGVGISFPTWQQDAIPAHVGRLLAYALTDPQANPTQRGLIATALHWRPLTEQMRGVAPTLKGLAGTWAVPGDGYAEKLAAIGRAIQKV
jgi:N-acetyl-anhydromuramyl-L-alanine amidase AmpD